MNIGDRVAYTMRPHQQGTVIGFHERWTAPGTRIVFIRWDAPAAYLSDTLPPVCESERFLTTIAPAIQAPKEAA